MYKGERTVSSSTLYPLCAMMVGFPTVLNILKVFKIMSFPLHGSTLMLNSEYLFKQVLADFIKE